MLHQTLGAIVLEESRGVAEGLELSLEDALGVKNVNWKTDIFYTLPVEGLASEGFNDLLQVLALLFVAIFVDESAFFLVNSPVDPPAWLNSKLPVIFFFLQGISDER